MAATYCSEAQVVSQIGIIDPNDTSKRLTVGDNTLPTKEEVTNLIEDAEDYIDVFCNTAWRTKTIADEYHSFPLGTLYQYGLWRNNGYYIQLGNRYVISLTKLEIYETNSWDDLIIIGTEGVGQLDGDWWLNKQRGILWLNSNYPVFGEETIRVTYTYGQNVGSVPNIIRRACILLASAWLVEAGFDYNNININNDMSMNNQEKAESWETRAIRLLESEYLHPPIPQR